MADEVKTGEINMLNSNGVCVLGGHTTARDIDCNFDCANCNLYIYWYMKSNEHVVIGR